MILFPKEPISYQPPSNFNEEDTNLFDPSNFDCTINQVELTVIKNVVATNVFVFKNLKVLYSYTSSLYQPKFKFYFSELVKRYIYPQVRIENATIGFQISHSNYFHWITETLPGLVAIYCKHKNIQVILSPNTLLYEHIVDSLKIFNIPYYCKNQKQNVKIENFYGIQVPQIGFYNVSFLSTFRDDFIKRLAIDQNTTPYRKIFISRKNATCRKISNEEEFCFFLKQHNFEVVYLENLKIQDQIKLLYESKIVISSHGAGLTNILFMQQGQKVIELKAINSTYWCYFTLARVAKLDYNYMLCQSETTDYRVSDIVVDLKRIEKLL